jgi:dienelactone hydrolase
MGKAQQTVTFKSIDGVDITADLYIQDKSEPFILLFHQANFSRGEYLETAPKFMKLGYNCLAVDLRSGKEVNYIQNETARRAIDKDLPTNYLDAEKDIVASIDYIKQYTKDKIILVGSSYSASLALLIAKNNPLVSAVLAFSPGEYFGSAHNLKNELTGFNKPLFVASTKNEHPFAKEMLSGIPEALVTWYTPSTGEGMHGSRALWQSNPDNEACWMSVLMFFKSLKK